jgi:hypothetical protein
MLLCDRNTPRDRKFVVVVVKAYRKAYRYSRSSFTADANTQNKSLVNAVHTGNSLRNQRYRKKPLVFVVVAVVNPNLQVLRGSRRGLSIPYAFSGFDRHTCARGWHRGKAKPQLTRRENVSRDGRRCGDRRCAMLRKYKFELIHIFMTGVYS